jgi:hypothetical protein
MSQWSLTVGGAEYELTGAHALMPSNAPRIEDIAHALAQTNRFNGHAKRPYSVAEHSLLVADIAAGRGATAVVQLACLMHDAHEAYTGDQTSPIKWALGAPWAAFEAPHIANLRHTFGLKTVFSGARYEIKQCDLIALATERRDLTSYDPAIHRPWQIIDGPPAVQPCGVQLDAHWRNVMSWDEWRDRFLERFADLREALDNTSQKGQRA